MLQRRRSQDSGAALYQAREDNGGIAGVGREVLAKTQRSPLRTGWSRFNVVGQAEKVISALAPCLMEPPSFFPSSSLFPG